MGDSYDHDWDHDPELEAEQAVDAMAIGEASVQPWSADALENAADEDLVVALISAVNDNLKAGHQSLLLQLSQEVSRRLTLMREENGQMAQRLAEAIYQSIPAVVTVEKKTEKKTEKLDKMDLFNEMFPSKSAPKIDLFADMLAEAKVTAKPKPPKAAVFVTDYCDRYVEFYAECVKETDLAILVKVGDARLWFPKSTVHEDSTVYGEGHNGALIVSTKMAEEKGLV